MQRITLDGSRIVDWDSFHDEFARLFGFPAFYGRNMNAWIDCMSYLTEPSAEMSSVSLGPDEPLLLEVTGAEPFRERCPEVFAALVDCTAFVNGRYRDCGEGAVVCIVFLP
jgi:hypothetical protein